MDCKSFHKFEWAGGAKCGSAPSHTFYAFSNVFSIAIILPTGKFPPTKTASEAIDSNPSGDADQKDS